MLQGKATRAEETFSSLKKTIKSKFVSEDAIKKDPQAYQQAEVQEEPKEVIDRRPLAIRLQEMRKKREEENEEMFRLANRVYKITDEEKAFYEKLEKKEQEKLEAIKRREREELERFKADELMLKEALAKKEQVQPVQEPIKKRARDIQKEIVSTGIVLKKKRKEEELVKEVSPPPPAPAPKTLGLVASYGSDSDSD